MTDPALGAVLDDDRGSLPFALIHGEALVACAAWALGEAGVTAVDARYAWAGAGRGGRAVRAARPAVPDDARRPSSPSASRRVPRPRPGRGRRPAGHRHGQGGRGRVRRRHRRPRRAASRSPRPSCCPPRWSRVSTALPTHRLRRARRRLRRRYPVELVEAPPAARRVGSARRRAGARGADPTASSPPPGARSRGDVLGEGDLEVARGRSARPRPAGRRSRSSSAAVSVPSKPSASAARYAASSVAARNACGVWTPTSPGASPGARRRSSRPVQRDRPGSRRRARAAAPIRRREQVGAGQGPGAVVDRDDVDRPGLDLGRQHLERLPLRARAGWRRRSRAATSRRPGRAASGARHRRRRSPARGPPAAIRRTSSTRQRRRAPTRRAPARPPSGSSTLLVSAPTRVPAPAARTTTAAGTARLVRGRHPSERSGVRAPVFTAVTRRRQRHNTCGVLRSTSARGSA